MTARSRRRWPTRAELTEFTRRLVRAQWPILSVAVIFVIAFALVAAGFWRRGSLLIGIAVGLAAVLRLVMARPLAVKSTASPRSWLENPGRAVGGRHW